MRQLLLAATAGAALFFSHLGFADVLRVDHPNEYVVVKGDTLWDISARFLEKPWLWPQIWKKNPQIKDPHWIYPGDVVRLEYVDGKPYLSINHTPAPATAPPQAPIGAIDTKQLEPFLKDLRVVRTFKNMPYVLGNEEGQLLATENQMVYVKGLQGVSAGQTVEFFRPSVHFARAYQGSYQKSTATDLNARGDRRYVDGESFWYGLFTSPNSKDYIGTELIRQGNGRIMQLSGDVATVLITDATREIRPGDRVAPSADGAPYDAYFFPSAGPDIGVDNRIMAVRDGMTAGKYSVVAIPIGSQQGVRSGSTYTVWSAGELVPDRIKHRGEAAAQADRTRMPAELVGQIMVFRTFDQVSYALVMRSNRPVRAGDYLKAPTSN